MTEENKDKRSVFTDALETLGYIIDDTQKRDAIHLAVEPVVANQMLLPGMHVNADGWIPEDIGECVGIVDPFLIEPVQRGERFWLVVYPRTIKSLRHVWEHPDFPPSEVSVNQEEEESVEVSKKWMINYGEEMAFTYESLMNAANDFLSNNRYWNLGYQFDGETLNNDFWYHYEIIIGEKIDQEKKQNFFTCSC